MFDITMNANRKIIPELKKLQGSWVANGGSVATGGKLSNQLFQECERYLSQLFKKCKFFSFFFTNAHETNYAFKKIVEKRRNTTTKNEYKNINISKAERSLIGTKVE